MPFFYFALFVPFVMLVFSVAFLIAARSGSRPALYWGFAHMMIAVGFGAPALEGYIPIKLQALLADGFLLIGAVLYGQALLIRFKAPRYLLLQSGFALVAFIVVAGAVLIAESLPLELGLHDAFTCALWLFPLFVVAPRLRAPIDWALAAVTLMIVLDVIVRNIIVYAIAPSGMHCRASAIRVTPSSCRPPAPSSARCLRLLPSRRSRSTCLAAIGSRRNSIR